MFFCFYLLQKDHIDEDCLTEMAIHNGRSKEDMRAIISEWKYDYDTATYLLLFNKKIHNRPARLIPQRNNREFLDRVSYKIMCKHKYTIYSCTEVVESAGLAFMLLLYHFQCISSLLVSACQFFRIQFQP